MKKIFILIFCLGFISQSKAQEIRSIKNSTEVIATTNTPVNEEYILVIHSTPFCGYCWKLKSYLIEKQFSSYIKIVFIEYDGDTTNFFKNKKSYNGAEVRVINPDEKNSVKLFPTIELYSVSKNKRLKKIKGFNVSKFDKILELSEYNEQGKQAE